MRYQKIHSQIWNDEKFIKLTPSQQRLFFYLLTCPHGNILGLYVLKEGYACEDLKSFPKDFRKDLAKLIEMGLIEYDFNVSVVFIKNFLKHNPITNPNQIKAVIKLIKELPKTQLIQRLKGLIKGLPEGLLEGLSEGLSKPDTDTDTEYNNISISHVKNSHSDSLTESERDDTPLSLSATKSGKVKRVNSRGYPPDDEFIASLKENPAYKGIDIEKELGKMKAWLMTPRGKRRKLTRGFIVNWLNKIDKPIEIEDQYEGYEIVNPLPGKRSPPPSDKCEIINPISLLKGEANGK